LEEAAAIVHLIWQHIIKQCIKNGCDINKMGRACRTHWRDEKCIILVRKLEANRPLGNIYIDRMVILKPILEKLGGNACELDSFGSGQRSVAGSYEHRN
jgi:hypothetical protein